MAKQMLFCCSEIISNITRERKVIISLEEIHHFQKQVNFEFCIYVEVIIHCQKS